MVDDTLPAAGLPDGFWTVKAPDLNLALGEAAPPIVVDLRKLDETANGIIEGALLIPVDQLPVNLGQFLDKTAAIVVVCQSGHRGVTADGNAQARL